MFRIENGEDVSTQEFDRFVAPHWDKINNYVEKNIIPDVCAFYLATGFRDNAIWEHHFDIHIGTVLDMFNHNFKITPKMKNEIKKILASKYGYHIVSENPLRFKEK